MRTILIIDDNAASARQARALLEADGFRHRRGGRRRVRPRSRPRALRPDLVLLDIGLPDVEGFEVARSARDRRPAAAGRPDLQPRCASEYGPRLTRQPRRSGFIPKDEFSGAAIRALVDGG